MNFNHIFGFFHISSDVSGDGYYVYIKAFDKVTNQKGRLISPIINSTLASHPSN